MNYHKYTLTDLLKNQKTHRKFNSEHYQMPKLSLERVQFNQGSPQQRFNINFATKKTSITCTTTRQTSSRHHFRIETRHLHETGQNLQITVDSLKQDKIHFLPTTPRITTNFIDTPELQDDDFLGTKRTKQELRQILIRSLYKLKDMNIDPETMIEKKVFSKKPYQRQNSHEFIHSVKLNQVSKVTEFLEKNQYLVFDFDYYNMTALHWACKKGLYEIAFILIKYHADVDAIDILNRTPLYISIEGQHDDITELLLKNKAYPWSTKLTNLGSVIKDNYKVKRMLTTIKRKDIVNLFSDRKQ